MKIFASFFLLVAVAIALALACGSPASHVPSCSSVPTITNSGLPQSVTLCPALADAKDELRARFKKPLPGR